MIYIFTLLLADFVCVKAKLVCEAVAVNSSATSHTAAMPARAVDTKAVVANAVVLLPAVWVTPMVPVGNEGVPVRVGEADNTTVPVPVSSVSAPDKFAEVKEPNEVALPVEVTAPVKLALVVEVIPVRPAPLPANPVAVKIPVEGTKLIFVEDTF